MILFIALISILKKSKVARERVSGRQRAYRSCNPPIIFNYTWQELLEKNILTSSLLYYLNYFCWGGEVAHLLIKYTHRSATRTRPQNAEKYWLGLSETTLRIATREKQGKRKPKALNGFQK